MLIPKFPFHNNSIFSYIMSEYWTVPLPKMMSKDEQESSLHQLAHILSQYPQQWVVIYHIFLTIFFNILQGNFSIAFDAQLLSILSLSIF